MLPELPEIFDAAVNAVMPHTMIPQVMHLDDGVLHIGDESFDLERYERVYLCGAGKAALSMAEACESILNGHVDGGVIVAPETERELKHCSYVRSTHPMPSESSIEAADSLIARFGDATRNDLILFLLSGGTSALIEKPLAPVTLDELAETTKLLLENGCSIEETNAVRKHLSTIKGGRLARMTEARVVVLVISDVIGDSLETIGSAPLYSDGSTYGGTMEMLREKELLDRLPQSVRAVLGAGERGEIGETPDVPAAHVTHLIIGSNRLALEAASAFAVGLGLQVHLELRPIRGDVNEAAAAFCRTFEALPPGTLMLQGGETTVAVGEGGRGGRNQHFALLCLQRLQARYDYDMLCAGTDGIDGNSDAAGARISNRLYERTTPKELEAAAAAFDSNTFFARKGALIKTGYTGTNVMDLVVAYKGDDNG